MAELTRGTPNTDTARVSTAWQHNDANRVTWRKQRVRILKRDGYRCRIQADGCTGTATQVDHLVPWIPGSIVPDSQLQAACAHCNASVGSPEKRNPRVERPAWLA